MKFWLCDGTADMCGLGPHAARRTGSNPVMAILKDYGAVTQLLRVLVS